VLVVIITITTSQHIVLHVLMVIIQALDQLVVRVVLLVLTRLQVLVHVQAVQLELILQ